MNTLSVNLQYCYHGTDLHELEDGVVLLDEEVRGVAPVVQHHVGLPVFRLNHS